MLPGSPLSSHVYRKEGINTRSTVSACEKPLVGPIGGLPHVANPLSYSLIAWLHVTWNPFTSICCSLTSIHHSSALTLIMCFICMLCLFLTATIFASCQRGLSWYFIFFTSIWFFRSKLSFIRLPRSRWHTQTLLTYLGLFSSTQYFATGFGPLVSFQGLPWLAALRLRAFSFLYISWRTDCDRPQIIKIWVVFPSFFMIKAIHSASTWTGLAKQWMLWVRKQTTVV